MIVSLATINNVHISIPRLPRGCNSWVIVDKATGGAVAEFTNRSTVGKINCDRYTIKTAAQYLGELNQRIKLKQRR